jgi:hypothetical protein
LFSHPSFFLYCFRFLFLSSRFLLLYYPVCSFSICSFSLTLLSSLQSHLNLLYSPVSLLSFPILFFVLYALCVFLSL